ncbi:reverse transcriptase domain-containing protein [Tanacetum coccineum]|uniref:Reverse transcriptase domain-containing protein n=1 Tax=Tanacetum coccineum TaxID=301880 RepID=A0ABQ5DJ34_9ASTR
MRDLSGRNNRKFLQINQKILKYIYKKLRKWDPVIGKIKKSSINTDFAGGTIADPMVASRKLTQLPCLVQNIISRARRSSPTSNLRALGRNSIIQEVSEYSESRTPNVRGEHRRGRRSRHSRSMSGSPEHTNVFSRIRRDRSESPRHRLVGKERRDGGVFNRIRSKEKSVFAHSESRYQSPRSGRTESVPRKRHYEGTCSRRTKMLFESEDSGGGHWKSKLKKQKSSIEEFDLSQPWVCEETDPFTPRIRYFDLPKKTRMPNNVKTYDGSDDWEDHLKIFQAATKVERYADLKKVFLANFFQQKKCIKDPVEIHHIKQRDGESTKDFVQRFKTESRHVKGDPKCMRISGFMHGITNPKLIKRLYDNIPKSGKFKTPPPMTTIVEKRNNNKFCWKAVARDQRALKQDKIRLMLAKKGETSEKDKPLAILMVQPWQRVARQRITQSFSPNPEISFPPFGDEDGIEGPMIIEAE